MKTLKEWKYLLQWPNTISCSEMTLVGRDNDVPFAIGKGSFEIIDPHRFKYKLIGSFPNELSSLSRLQEALFNPYDELARFRLIFTDESGRKFNAGWTIPDITQMNSDEWMCQGESDGLSIAISHENIIEHNSTELIYLFPKNSLAYAFFSKHCTSSHHIEILGSKIDFEFESSSGLLSVMATTSLELPLTYTENWLGEPLRIMMGDLIYPMLVARNFPDGKSSVFFRRMSSLLNLSPWIALWRSENILEDNEKFWEMFKKLLNYIATTPDKYGQRYFESNKLTRHYEELIQAGMGSRWVWALTLASTVEALVLEFYPRGMKDNSADIHAINSLSNHIKNWSGNNDLKSAAISAVKRKEQIPVSKALSIMRGKGEVFHEGVEAWNSIRNTVMHGSLISTYSDKEEDEKIINLANLVHCLTKKLISFS
ncbi:hypothetical protein [Pectobacterium versatile]|uniref:hypothetical protein n=1 Tax=Pectobacterium versatile TaxID=2488639 RepID=UPI0020BECA5E|nr:hypothetical protein [Pectobacterium versatile]